MTDSPVRFFASGARIPHPLRLFGAYVLAVVVVNVSNNGLSMIGRFVFSAPDDFCAFLPARSVPVTIAAITVTTVAWVALVVRTREPARRLYQGLKIAVIAALAASVLLLVTWQSLLGVLSLMLMVLVGASVTYLALTRIAPARSLCAQHFGDEEGQFQ